MCLLWTFFGAGLISRTPQPKWNTAQPTLHAACRCVLCKGGDKKCCCTPETAEILSANCDATQTVSGVAALPPLLATPSVNVLALPLVACASTQGWPTPTLPLVASSEQEAPPPRTSL